MKFKCFCDLCVFQDKAPFIAKVGKLKEEYEKTMCAYNMGITASEEEGSDKSKSEFDVLD